MPLRFTPKSAALLFIIGLGIGLLVTTQFRTPPQRVTNSLAPFLAVEQTHDDLQRENIELKSHIKNLREEINGLQDQAKKRKSTTKILAETVDGLKAEAGLTEKIDEGVVITLDDSRKVEVSTDSIVHAADLRDLVNVLWSAGARAVSVNDERLVATSSIDSIHNAILTNNTRMNPPFIIKALGDGAQLEATINTTPLLADIRNRSKNLGLVFHIEKTSEVTIKEFSGTFSITYTKIKE